MDDILVENDEIQSEYSSSSKDNALQSVSHEESTSKIGKRKTEDGKKKSTKRNMSDTTPIKSLDTKVAMMYTCPPTSPKTDTASTSHLPPLFYNFSEGGFADKIKFVFTTILFLGVVAMIVVVAIYKNPQM